MSPGMPTRSRKYNFWPPLLVALGLLFVVLVVWSLQRAQVPGRAVAAGYATQMSPAGAIVWEQRGWTSSLTLDRHLFRCELRDGRGQPLSGAHGHLQLAGTTPLPLVETAPGNYQAQLPTALAGAHVAQLTLARDGAQQIRNLQLQLAGP